MSSKLRPLAALTSVGCSSGVAGRSSTRLVDEVTEQALAGGRQTQGIVRVGQTVCRALHQRSDYVHALLRHLEAVGFDGAPRLLGIDAQGREVLTYLPGEVIILSPVWLSDARLDSAARPIRRFGDATAGSSLAGDQEVVGHGDLGPPQPRLRRRCGGRDHRLGRQRGPGVAAGRPRPCRVVLRRRCRGGGPSRRAGSQGAAQGTAVLTAVLPGHLRPSMPKGNALLISSKRLSFGT
jgi:hypothetical protein